MRIVNLDTLQTKREKVIVLGGVEHVMHTLTVKDYIHQMKQAQKIQSLTKEPSEASAEKMLDLTIQVLMKSFPTITKDQFESLSMEQLTAIRELAEETATDDLTDGDEGNAAGKTE